MPREFVATYVFTLLLCQKVEMKLHLAAMMLVCGSATAKDIDWMEIQPGFSVGRSPTVEIPVRTEQPGVVMTYRVRMPVANCWTKSGTIEMLDIKDERVLGTVELGASKAAERFARVLCSVIAKEP